MRFNIGLLANWHCAGKPEPNIVQAKARRPNLPLNDVDRASLKKMLITPNQNSDEGVIEKVKQRFLDYAKEKLNDGYNVSTLLQRFNEWGNKYYNRRPPEMTEHTIAPKLYGLTGGKI